MRAQGKTRLGLIFCVILSMLTAGIAQSKASENTKFIDSESSVRFYPGTLSWNTSAYISNPQKDYYNFKINSLPFFCRLEEEFRAEYSVPFKFRLGTVEYVDKLENKP